MINVLNLTINYKDKKIIDNASFKVLDGKCLVLFGPSGCGKTSILNAIANLIPYEGSIILSGKISYSFQSPKLFLNSTVFENLSFVTNDLKKINYYLNLFEIDNLKKEKVYKLSGGQMARVNIIRSLIKNDILLLDEPFNSLDLALKEKIMTCIKKEISNKKGTIFVTHDLDEALFLGDTLYCISKNKLEEVSLESKSIKENIIKKLA